MSIGRVLVRFRRALVSFFRVFPGYSMVTFFVMLGSSLMGLCCVFVMFSSLLVRFLSHEYSLFWALLSPNKRISMLMKVSPIPKAWFRSVKQPVWQLLRINFSEDRFVLTGRGTSSSVCRRGASTAGWDAALSRRSA